MLQTLFWIVSLVVLVLTLVGVVAPQSARSSQRRNEIGLRKALGASSRAIGTEFYIESSLYGLIGGLIGTAIGYGLAGWLCMAVFERSIGFNWWLALISVLFSALTPSSPPSRPSTAPPASTPPSCFAKNKERETSCYLNSTTSRRSTATCMPWTTSI